MTPEPKPKSDGLVVKEVRKRKLAYTPEFKDRISLLHNIFKNFLRLSRGLQKREVAVDGELNVYLIDVKSDARYYKVKVGEEDLFVKEINDTEGIAWQGGGFREVEALKKAKEILVAHNIDWADVVDFKLGYELGSKKYFVSTWREFLRTSLSYYRRRLLDAPLFTRDPDIIKSKAEEAKILDERITTLLKVLKDFYDVRESNMAYDAESKKIYIYDISLSHPLEIVK